MVFRWSLGDCKFPQISRTLLSILANLNYTEVCIVSILFPLIDFFTPVLIRGFNKCPQVSRTLLSILTDFKSAVIWMMSILPPISCFCILFSRSFGTVSRTPTLIGVDVVGVVVAVSILICHKTLTTNFPTVETEAINVLGFLLW